MPHLRPLAPRHIPQAAALLGRAFQDAPGYVASFDRHTPAERLAVVSRIKRAACEGYARFAEADALWDGDRLAGASLIAPPGRYPIDLRAELLLYATAFTVGPRSIARLLHMARYMERQHIREPHYYLFVVGVEPALQGRGHGKALLRALSARADSRGVPCYLEADREQNVKLYRSLGYEVLDEGLIEPIGLRMWPMRREPR